MELMTPGYLRPLGSDNFSAQLFRSNTRDWLIQRETNGMNRDVLVCGGVFQECTLNFRVNVRV